MGFVEDALNLPEEASTEELVAFMFNKAAELLSNGWKVGRCAMGGEGVFFIEHSKALVPGHICSELGKAEYGITQLCEYHFGLLCSEPLEFVGDGEP